MKALKLYKFISHKEGTRLLEKREAIELYHALTQLQSFVAINEPFWLITTAQDAFGNNSYGCLNMLDGQWEYFREDEFDSIEESSSSI